MRILPAKSVRKGKPVFSNHPANGPDAADPRPYGPQVAQLKAVINAGNERKTLAGLRRTIDNSPRMSAQKICMDDIQREAAQKQGDSAGLPEGLRAGIENLSGLSMAGVRVHYNSPGPARWQALAYTQGRDIYVAPGQERHLPHEAWHVVQQARGRVPAMARSRKAAINYDAALEHQADIMGHRAAGPVAASARVARAAPAAMPANTMQFNGWTVAKFLQELQKECPSGVCDALTAVWLGNLIHPDSEDKTTGVDDQNLGKILLLKQLFLQTGANSEILTFAFAQFLKDKEKEQLGSAKAWFDELSDDTLNAKTHELQTYVGSETGNTVKNSIKNLELMTDPILYDGIDNNMLANLISQKLGPFLNHGFRLHGLVIINAYRGDELGNFDIAPSANHQFAFRYYGRTSKQFHIMDQTTGLSNLQYNDIGEIPLALANYIDATYIKQPLKGENSFSTPKIDFKEIMNMDLKNMENELNNLPSYSPPKKETETVTKGAVIRMRLRRDTK
jgi:hypothetical protein